MTWRCEGCGTANAADERECDGCGEGRATAVLTRAQLVTIARKAQR